MVTASEVRARRGILLVVAAAAATAALAGLARLGLDVPWGTMRAAEHGPLFALGVFGTVIGLERAVALSRPWSYAAPALGACGAIALLAALPGAAWALAASSVALVLVNVAIVRRQSLAFTWLMLLGSAVLAAGTVAFALGRPVFEVVPTWVAFFVLTIVAERLELSRLAPTPAWATRALVVLALGVSLAALATMLERHTAPRALGVAFSLSGAWQLRFDLARRTVRQRGLPRYAALGVLLGAGWLVVAGVLLAVAGLPVAGVVYDAILHAVLVGFVVSMVFAHAPIILPAVARIEIPFHPVLYVPLAALHLGVVARVLGDLASDALYRRIGGIANAVALALFLVAVLWARARARARARAHERRR